MNLILSFIMKLVYTNILIINERNKFVSLIRQHFVFKFLTILFNLSQVKFSLHDLMLEIVEALVESFLSN